MGRFKNGKKMLTELVPFKPALHIAANPAVILCIIDGDGEIEILGHKVSTPLMIHHKGKLCCARLVNNDGWRGYDISIKSQYLGYVDTKLCRLE